MGKKGRDRLPSFGRSPRLSLAISKLVKGSGGKTRLKAAPFSHFRKLMADGKLSGRLGTSIMLDLESYLALRERPAGKPVMFQEWLDLTFLHLASEPSEVQAMLPKGLTVDTFPDASGREMAWMGLVPFQMRGIRPVHFPALPWISAFPETNVRTYVHREGREPGVWFFSLDAARKLACMVARATFRLPYWWSRMSVETRDGVVSYRSRRIEGPSRPELEILARPTGPVRLAEPGSFEFFLVERYLLYAEKGGQFFTGRVWHEPYQIQDVELLTCNQNFVESSEWVHMAFAPGAKVEVFGIQLVG